MPIFSIHTNVPVEASKATEIAKEFSKVIARILGKPESYVSVHIQAGSSLVFGGSSDPAGYAVLKSIGGVGGKKNNDHSQELFPLVEKFFGIPGNRFYIEYINIGAADIAFSGATFA
ncbi:unnamed protein product [Caenorhabditis bovis]|uniref:L-dopachrome isomerase n=1 Tax=Caenorhabditis bovis TaxID=2654633 RepID=A0A8S1EKM3_9PELO|nr:unnamed protein product [Caenorhabditis bovis]